MTLISRILCIALLSLGLQPGAARAETSDTGVFDLTIAGFRVGVLAFNAVQSGDRYAVAGLLKSVGLVSWIRDIRYDAKAAGTIHETSGGPVYVPARYQETANTGERWSQSVMRYHDGVPQLRTYKPPRPANKPKVNPATQGGTIDPLTALYATLRDVPRDRACKLHVFMFDGARRSSLTLQPAQVKGDTITCAGEYRRLKGFSKKEMAEKSRFPFRLTYRPAGHGMVRVTEVWMDSLYGQARLKRR